MVPPPSRTRFSVSRHLFRQPRAPGPRLPGSSPKMNIECHGTPSHQRFHGKCRVADTFQEYHEIFDGRCSSFIPVSPPKNPGQSPFGQVLAPAAFQFLLDLRGHPDQALNSPFTLEELIGEDVIFRDAWESPGRPGSPAYRPGRVEKVIPEGVIPLNSRFTTMIPFTSGSIRAIASKQPQQVIGTSITL